MNDQNMKLILIKLDQYVESTNTTIRELRETLKKLHMEVVGTQNDMLKFKDEIVLNLIKCDLHLYDIKKALAKDENQHALNQSKD